MHKKRSWAYALIISCAISFLIGIFSVLIGPSGFFLFNLDKKEEEILLGIRFPRVLTGFFAGGALSLSGLLLQGVFRNVLVEPYTLGISGGASFFVALSVVSNLEGALGGFSSPFFGFIGASFVLLIILYLASKRNLKKEEILLSGVMISFISSSLIMLLFAIIRSEDVHRIILWMMGSLQEDRSELIFLLSLVSIFSLFFSFFYSPNLNALQLGEEEAKHLGVDVYRTRFVLLFLSSLATGVTVSICGIIGFVGLLVPHITRLMFGSDYRFLIFSSFFFGSGFLLISDAISRVIIKPMELPVGVITGIVGGSLFVYLLLRKRV